MRGDGVKAEVGEAIEELKRAFPSSELTVREDGKGGARVVVESVAIGERYEPEQSWLGGHIPAQYPLCRHLSGVHGRCGAPPGRQSFRGADHDGAQFLRAPGYPDLPAETTGCRIPGRLPWPSSSRSSISWKKSNEE